MIVNSDITVFNKRYDRTERTERFYGTQIRGVSFYSGKVHHPEARSCRKAMPTQSGFRQTPTHPGRNTQIRKRIRNWMIRFSLVTGRCSLEQSLSKGWLTWRQQQKRS